MEFKSYEVVKDLIVVGGGMPGICAAVQAARHGLTVALINNRGYLGGNASAEAFVSVSGATGTQEFNFYARESGILEEIMLENLHRNPQGNRFIWDTVLLDFVLREKSIELFQNTNVDRVEVKEHKTIVYASGVQSTTEKRFNFFGRCFLDDTGDGTLGYLAGAEFRKGREAKEEFNESLAPDKADHYVLPSTLNFTAHDTGKPVTYIAPDFAIDLTKTEALKYRVIPKDHFHASCWFYEVGGELDQIEDNEEIIQKHRELIYGIWDYIKNSGEYPSENYDLSYVSCIPGKRESRRLMGDYILKEEDIVLQKDFEDTVGYGGWSIDLHAVHGFFSKDLVNRHVFLKGIYQIPYRTGYSKNIDNLFMAGRCMSTTHVAFGSTRVMATLSTLGQALGTAAYLCKKYETTPRGIYQNHIKELQQLIIKNDQFVVGESGEDANNLMRGADIKVSSVKKCELKNQTGSLKLEKDMGILVPVKEHIKSIYLLVRSSKDVHINYTVYVPNKKENYNPENKIAAHWAFVKASSKFAWVELPIDKEIDHSKVFVELAAEAALEIAVTGSRLTGVDCMQKEASNQSTILDVDTFEQKKYLWKRMKDTFCFTLSQEEDIYGARNIHNGYIRPYGLPNLWISDNKIEGEYVQIDFKREKEIRKITMTFDSDLDMWLWNTKYHDSNAISSVVRDYTVYYKTNGGYEKLTEVKGNFQRVNRLRFDPIRTEEIKIVFQATHGSPCTGVYAMDVY